jgi:hypothetical protein
VYDSRRFEQESEASPAKTQRQLGAIVPAVTDDFPVMTVGAEC